MPAMSAADWNARYPVGTPVTAYPDIRPEIGGTDVPTLHTKTRSRAWNLGAEPVVMVDGYAGGISLEHIDLRDEPETATEPPALTFDLGPVRCPVPGCWSVHGIPDQYTAARENALAEHLMSDEHRRNAADLTAARTQPAPALDLDTIQARHQAATGGTWYLQPKYGPDFVASEIAGYEHGIGTLDFGVDDQADADREFVLNAHADMGELIARVRDLQQQLAAHQNAITAVRALDKHAGEASDDRYERYEQLDPEDYQGARAVDDTLWDVMNAIDTALGTEATGSPAAPR